MHMPAEKIQLHDNLRKPSIEKYRKMYDEYL